MRVLVVDDEKLLVKGIKFNLEQEGYSVLTAFDGEEAIRLAHDDTIDIILLDLMLPKVDGFTVCRHQMWKAEDESTVEKLTDIFAKVESLYVADGHHRAASAVKVALKRRAENPGYTGEEEFNYFLSVLFPEEQLKIYDYNRIVHNVSGKTGDHLIKELEKNFLVDRMGDTVYRPQRKGEIGMYLKGAGYRLRIKTEVCPDDPVEGLDVSILQNEVLAPIFGIQNPKTDERMEFVGGIRGLNVLKETVDKEEGAAAFAMYPTSLEELLAVADAGKLMPPKSTWFEPKLRSGMVIHGF